MIIKLVDNLRLDSVKAVPVNSGRFGRRSDREGYGHGGEGMRDTTTTTRPFALETVRIWKSEWQKFSHSALHVLSLSHSNILACFQSMKCLYIIHTTT